MDVPSARNSPRVGHLFMQGFRRSLNLQSCDFLRIIADASPIIWVHEMNFPSVINRKYKDVIVSPLGVYSNQAYAWFDK